MTDETASVQGEPKPGEYLSIAANQRVKREDEAARCEATVPAPSDEPTRVASSGDEPTPAAESWPAPSDEAVEAARCRSCEAENARLREALVRLSAAVGEEVRFERMCPVVFDARAHALAILYEHGQGVCPSCGEHCEGMIDCDKREKRRKAER